MLRVVGVESETELPFAALHQLCAPLLDRLERLPAAAAGRAGDGVRPARRATAGPVPVGLAVLTLLSEVADERPLLCVVDDAQWLDRASAQVLGFVARRLLAEPIGLLFAPREARPGDGRPAGAGGRRPARRRRPRPAGLGGPVRLDQQVRDRIVAETRGNPLALIELPRGLTTTQLAGGLGLTGATRLPDRIEEQLPRRGSTALPADARLLLLVAAAEPDGDPVLIGRAAARLDIPVQAAPPRPGPRACWCWTRGCAFRHPLVRSAVYRAAPRDQRRLVHSGARRRHRRGRRPRPPGLAPGRGGDRAGRGRRRGAGARRPAGRRPAAAWRRRRRSCSGPRP